MKVDLDRRENLDGFQKLVLTLRTFSISISIGLDVETTRLITIEMIDLNGLFQTRSKVRTGGVRVSTGHHGRPDLHFG
jgi:hypothetical protein